MLIPCVLSSLLASRRNRVAVHARAPSNAIALPLRYSLLSLTPPPRRPQVHFHDVEPPEQYGRGQQGKSNLVKFWVLEVVVVTGNEKGEGDEGDGEEERVSRGSLVGEGGIAGEASGIYHGELVDELHWVCKDTTACTLEAHSVKHGSDFRPGKCSAVHTFQSSVEEKTSNPDSAVAKESDEKYSVVAIVVTI